MPSKNQILLYAESGKIRNAEKEATTRLWVPWKTLLAIVWSFFAVITMVSGHIGIGGCLVVMLFVLNPNVDPEVFRRRSLEWATLESDTRSLGDIPLDLSILDRFNKLNTSDP